jgi:lipopolysaccharide transport system ATP-binding protein
MSYDKLVIEIEQASKCYHLYGAPVDRLKQFVVPRLRRFLGLIDQPSYFKEFWSLRNVSLKVSRGEVLGLVGTNGAGKSTLLQLICGVLQPLKYTVVLLPYWSWALDLILNLVGERISF